MAELAEPAGVPLHSSARVRGVVHLFASQGVEADWLLRAAGVEPERLKHAHERFTLGEFDRMWNLAVGRTGQVNLGLDRALARRHIDFNIAAQAMWSSPDLGAGLAVLQKYLHLIHDASSFALVADRGDRWLVLDWGADGTSPRQRVEFAMFGVLLLLQAVTHHQLRPLVIEFVFAEPADLHAYRMAFHCRREEVARSLGVTEPAFERRLKAEGNGFEELFDGVRRELAEHYLHQAGYTPTRVANLLGWETPARLAAACKRWFGVPTAQYRSQAH